MLSSVQSEALLKAQHAVQIWAAPEGTARRARQDQQHAETHLAMRKSRCTWLCSCLTQGLPRGLLGSQLHCTGMHSIRQSVLLCVQSLKGAALHAGLDSLAHHRQRVLLPPEHTRDADAAVSMVRSQTGVLTRDRLRLGRRLLLLGSWCHCRRLAPQPCTSNCLPVGRQSVCLLRLRRHSLNCLRRLLLLVCSGLGRHLLLLLVGSGLRGHLLLLLVCSGLRRHLLLRRSLLLRLLHLSWRAHAGRRCGTLVGDGFSQHGATGLHIAGSWGLPWLLRLRLGEGRLRLLEQGDLQQASWHCEGRVAGELLQTLSAGCVCLSRVTCSRQAGIARAE